ncbi:hypothetical protein SO802_017504 [Lithocarpus litseifolius]|uniref:Reverse transcriptase zinc-binding domain-containing protein n=1 Tax=Lithocarpus litseifolius TaxID=425828 RepID=A0AAW2CJL7_9ROSI
MHPDTMVSELKNMKDGSWKKEVIDTLFLPHEVEQIQRIPLSSHFPVDKQIWAWSSYGKFTVRNAYWVAKEMSKSRECGSCSDERHNRRFWLKLWKIPVPHKIRHFTWRACMYSQGPTVVFTDGGGEPTREGCSGGDQCVDIMEE